MANGNDPFLMNQRALPGGRLWPPFYNMAPPALPFGIKEVCFDWCHQTPPCALNHFPIPCQGTFTCTNTGGPPPYA